MALNNRVVQNIDLQGDATPLKQALTGIGTELKSIVGSAGELSKQLAGGAKAGDVQFNNTLKTIRLLIAQATTLQNILDGTASKRTARGKGLLDEQALGRQSSAAAKLSRDLGTTATSAEALEKRLTLLNQRFAELGRRGQTVSRNDLSKQFRIQEALKQVNQLQSSITRLNGRALNTPTGGASQEMQRLRAEIDRVNTGLLQTAQNTRKSNFQPQIDQLRALVDQYNKLISVEIRAAEVAGPRGLRANTTAQSILNQTDAQRLAAVQRASAGAQFPAGISNTVSQKVAEDQLAVSLNQRLRLIKLIQEAQDRGAPVRSVERLNQAYTSLNTKIGEQYKLLTQVNREQTNTPGTAAFQQRAANARAAINEQLFGDGGIGFAKRIAGASVITTGVFAVINALQSGAKFIVDYEAALKSLQAISGATDTQLRTLADGIGVVSRNSTSSILEITKAAQTIAQAGFSAGETLNVLRGTVTLSSAAGVAPQQAADTLTSTLGAFNLQASETDRVVDVMVTALNRTKLSIDQVQAAIQYAGATAKENNIQFTDLTAVIASLAQAGIRSGSTIGTGLRQLLVDLQTPTKEFKKNLADVGLTLADVDVKTKGFAEVVRTLANAGFTASNAYESFETRAAATFLAFKGQLPVYDQLALSIAAGGAAATAQEKAMDSLGSQYTRLVNALGEFAAAVGGPFVNALKVVTSLLATMVEGLADLFKAFGQILEPLGVFGTGLQVAGLALAGFAIGGPMGAAIGGLIGLLGALGGTNAEMDKLETNTSEASSRLTAQTQTVGSLEDAITSLIDREQVLRTNHVALQTETINLGERFKDLYGYLGNTAKGYDDLLAAMLRYREAALRQQKVEAESLKTSAELQLGALRREVATPGTEGNLGQEVVRSQIGTMTDQRQARLFTQALGRSGGKTADATFNDVAFVSTQLNNARRLQDRYENDFKSGRDSFIGDVVKSLEDRLAKLKQIQALQSQIQAADTQIGIADARTAPAEVARTRAILNLHGDVTKALGTNGANRYGAISRVRAQAEQQISAIQDELKDTKSDTARFAVLQDDLAKAQAELARLTTASRVDSEEKPDKAGAGRSLTGAQVAGNLRRAFPGINPYSYGQRSLAEQTRLYNDYKAGRGPLAAKPGRSNHGTGNAIDITPLKGYTLDDIVAYVESLGLEVTEALNERNPRTGAYHWHVAWKARTSSYRKSEDSALATLQRARASKTTQAASSAIEAILAEARAGKDTPENLRARLSAATDNYTKAAIAEYDTQHPTTGLSGAALQAQQEGRAELIKSLKEKAAKFSADLSKQIDDVSTKALDAALKAIDDGLKNSEYAAQAGVRAATRAEDVAGNNLNKGRIDPGTSYYLNRQKFNATLRSDTDIASLRDAANAQKAVLLGDRQDELNGLPAGEDKDNKLKALQADWQALTKAMQANDELWDSINARTERFVQLPLSERLKEGVAAWADQSGIMDSWSDTLAKNVGPALDLVTDQFATLFSKLASGQATLKSALGAMIQAIGQFVMQMIAKALALMAIKWFLSLIGLELVDSPGGVTIGKMPKQMTGGPIGEPLKLLGGGSTGYISQGVRNRDTVPILGAQGEYMVRSAAVDSIGLEGMNAINRYGQKAIDKMGKPGMVLAGGNSHQEMNVYVIKPDEKPQLGPKDIVLAITDDMLQGGQTKQLVRQISQGG